MGKRSKRKRGDKRSRPSPLETRSPTGDGLDVGPDPRARPAVGAVELAARLASVSTILQRQLRRGDQSDGLTRARLSALALLVLGGPRRLGELASAEGVRPPTMTRLVRAMEDDGLVERRPDPTDGRSVVVAPTAAAEALIADGRAERIVPLAEAIDRLDAADVVLLDESTDLIGRLLRDVERG